MYLKRLEIRGFKTFAEPTELSLSPGINIIVGPNGCGKSNIVDAIRWVMGEANVRHLRGHKNEDVIFSGTDKIKALGMAQVEMTVDNHDGSLPLDYSEVSISRKMFRSGESEFYLNKSRVRMKDIINLYMDTGLGKKGYSIISQGELERVLNGQPFDRRLMLEEAAGTVRYRQQREEVQQRLSSTAQDLLRVEDIMAELGNRRTELFIKSQKAKAYLAKKAEADDLDKKVLSHQIQENLQNLALRRTERVERQASLDYTLAGKEKLEQQLHSEQNSLEEHKKQLAQMQENRYEIENLLNQRIAEINLGQERINNCRDRIETANKDQEKYGLNLRNLQLDLEAKIVDWEAEQEKYQAKTAEAERLSQEILDLEAIIGEQEKHLASHNNQVFERVQEETRMKNEITAGEERIRRGREKKERLAIRLGEIRLQQENAQASVAEVQERILELSGRKDNEQQELTNSKMAKDVCQQACQDIEGEFKHINEEIQKREHRQSILRDLRRSYVGYSEAVKNLCKALDRGEPRVQGILGTVADLIEVPEGLDIAISMALGRGLENIVVGNADVARTVIDYLKHRQLGRVTLLPLDLLRVKSVEGRPKAQIMQEPGVIGLAVDLLQYEDRFAKAVEYLLGRVVIVQDMEHGLNIFRKIDYPWRIVTVDGDIINASGAISSGSTSREAASPLQRKQEEKVLSQELKAWLLAKADNRTKAERQAGILSLQEADIARRNNLLAEIDFQLKMVAEEGKRLLTYLDNAEADENRYRREIDDIEKEIASTQKEIRLLLTTHRDMQIESQTINEEIASIKERLETNRRDLAVKQERQVSFQDQMNMKKRELAKVEENIAQFRQIQKSYQQSQREACQLLQGLEIEVQKQTATVSTAQAQTGIHQQELDACVRKTDQIQAIIGEITARVRNNLAQLAPSQEQAEKEREQIINVEMKIVRLETEIEGLRAKWLENHALQDLDEGRQLLSSRQLRDYRANSQSLREQIDSLGPIDIESIKDYDEVESRYSFIKAQIEDLCAAQLSLQNLLEETEKIMAQNFAQFLNLARASFRSTFVEIFNGGEASLNVDLTADLSAGVDIEVKMPGKRSQSLNLLSGGERALTCIAFIFALLRLKPAPFCLLDEIDASLDETNLTRFAEFLKGMARDTQFIVITHRQATIEAGHSIYGITMPQEGISSILSIPGEDVQRQAV